MAIIHEGSIDLPDLRIQGKGLVERVYKGVAGILSGIKESERALPIVTQRFSPIAEDQINAARAMFNELDEVAAGRRPNKRFIIR